MGERKTSQLVTSHESTPRDERGFWARLFGSKTPASQRLAPGRLDHETAAALRMVVKSLHAMHEQGYHQVEQICADYNEALSAEIRKERDAADAAGDTRALAMLPRKQRTLQLTKKQIEVMRHIAEGEHKGSTRLTGAQIRRLAKFLGDTGVAAFAYPALDWAGKDDMLYLAVAKGLGIDKSQYAPFKPSDAQRAAWNEARQAGLLPEGEKAVTIKASYQTYSYNDPYLLRGYMEVTRQEGEVPARVTYFQGWRNVAGKYFWETYEGFILTRDWNAYLVLFGRDKDARALSRMRVFCLEGSVSSDGFFEKLRGAAVGFGSVDMGGPVAQEVVMYREPVRVDDPQLRTEAVLMADDKGREVKVHTPYYREFHVEEEIPVVEEKEKWVKVFSDLNLDLSFDYPRSGRSLQLVVPGGGESDE